MLSLQISLLFLFLDLWIIQLCSLYMRHIGLNSRTASNNLMRFERSLLDRNRSLNLFLVDLVHLSVLISVFGWLATLCRICISVFLFFHFKLLLFFYDETYYARALFELSRVMVSLHFNALVMLFVPVYGSGVVIQQISQVPVCVDSEFGKSIPSCFLDHLSDWCLN